MLLRRFAVTWQPLMLPPSFQSARLRAAGIGKDFKENPNLRDNWTDAEGYYRKFAFLINFKIHCAIP